MKDMTFKVDENGTLKEFKIIKYVKNPQTNKTYIIYCENDSDSEIYASAYHIVKGEVILDAIDNGEEWDYLDEVVNMED